MNKINWKHAVIGLVLGTIIALFMAGELRGRDLRSVRYTEAGVEG